MAYLGYDPERLARLVGALDDLADEARLRRSGDPEAAGPLASYQRAVRVLCDYRERIVAVQMCTFLDPIRLGSPGLVLDAGLVGPDGRPTVDREWRFVPETSEGTQADGAELATLVAHWLNTVDLVALCRDRQRFTQFVALATDVLARPGAADAFVTTLGPDAFAALVAQLSAIEQESQRADRPIGARAVSLLDLAAAALGARAPTYDDSDQPYLDALVAYDEVAAAFLAASGRLNDDQLTRLALLTRRAHERSGGVHEQLDDEGAYSDLVPGLLAKALAAQPTAGRAFLRSLPPDELSRFVRSVGPDRLGPLLLAVVDPTRFDRATSIDLVTSLINVFDRYREAAEGVRGILGQFIGPWLIEFVPLPAGRTSHDPRLDPTIGDPAWGRVRRLDLLRWIARDERSALALDVWSQVWTSAGVVSVLQAGGDTAGPLRDLGLKVGEVADAVRDATIDEASERESAWKVVFGFGVEVAASSVATAAGLSGGVPGFVAAEGLKAVTLAVGSGPLRRLFGIVPAGVVAGNELARARAEAVQFMSTIAALCYEHAIAGERLDPSAPPIPLPAPGELATIGLDEVQQRMLHWVAEGDGPASVAERRLVYDDVAIATEGFLESFSKLGWTMQRAMPR